MASNTDQLQSHKLDDAFRIHTDSFSWFLKDGLQNITAELPIHELTIPTTDLKFSFWIESLNVRHPNKDADKRLYPWECRLSGETYSGSLSATLCTRIGDGEIIKRDQDGGRIPIMLRSSYCWLNGLSKDQLIHFNEEPDERGGYFIASGIEKMLRLVIAPRRNFPFLIIRPSNANYGQNFTPYMCRVRSVSKSEKTISVQFHFLTDGDVVVRFKIDKANYLVPAALILKALLDSVTDREIFEGINERFADKPEVAVWCENLIRGGQGFDCVGRREHLALLGSKFKVQLGYSIPSSDMSDSEIGEFMLNNYVLIHLSSNEMKFHLAIYCIQRLYACALGDVLEESQDKLSSHEVVNAGILFCQQTQAFIERWLIKIKSFFTKQIKDTLAKKETRKAKEKEQEQEQEQDKMTDIDEAIMTILSPEGLMALFKKVTEKFRIDVGLGLTALVKTGTIRGITESVQVSGWSVTADRINYLRYLSHFRAVHRGNFFNTVRVTSIRKLLPESWGFMCPVHTPDGSPCGLLNHMASECTITTQDEHLDGEALTLLGVQPVSRGKPIPSSHLHVLLNGILIGSLPVDLADSFSTDIRKLKAEKKIPKFLELVSLKSTSGTLFPGVYLFTHKNRFMRPVYNLSLKIPEFIGPFEQAFTQVAIRLEDVKAGTPFMELKPENMLDFLACFTPFSDFNQSPRNMYQCQMAKQTLGFSAFNQAFRTDNTAYKITTPQAPLVRSYKQREYGILQRPQGTNAVVAVISYTGYDMEDAMIINKSSFERGFGHGTVFKTNFYTAKQLANSTSVFANTSPELGDDHIEEPNLDKDGLPHVGDYFKHGDVWLVTYDRSSRQFMKHKFKKDFGYIDKVVITESENTPEVGYITNVCITVRIPRPPTIGDKFSSRHGQKGVLGVLWPQENMPFTEAGITPDVIINPHAFPSRMTIGMLIESMAGKSAALHGHFTDSTPFRFSEDNTAVEYFGEQLASAGYNFYGNEAMYSGTYGTEFPADIYLGVVYYQRLRHMVNDKFQVRTTGIVNRLTQQPLKGRKRGGGIRFGEMERDSLLAHGTSFLLHDRLFKCSDASQAYVCSECRLILSVRNKRVVIGGRPILIPHCANCDSSKSVRLINLPFVFRYLAAELASVNIAIGLGVA